MRNMLPTPFLLLALLALASCSDQRLEDNRDDSPLQPTMGGRIVIAESSEPESLNPVTRTTSVAGAILGIVNKGLAEMGTDFEFRPLLATHWEFSDDGLTLSYHLRDGVLWSDGAPFSAHDVLASYRIWSDPVVASPRAANFKDIVAVETPDSLTVVFRFSHRSMDQIFNSSFSLLPAHKVEGLDPAQIQSWPINREPVTVGPYRLARWDAGERIVLERNPYYFGEPAYLDEIVFRVVPDESVRLLQLEIGEVDMVGQIPYKDIARLREKNPDLRLYELQGRNTGYLVYNLRRPQFEDRRVRQAISYAIDRRAIIEGLMFGFAEPTAAAIPPILSWAHHTGLEPHHRDPERSRALLAEAGWSDRDGDGILDRDGVALSFVLKTRTGDPVRENGALIIQRNLQEVGIHATPRMMELSTVLEQVREGDFDVYLGQYQARLSVDPTGLFATGGAWNYGGYSNPRVDELIQQGLAELDRDRAAAIWREMQEILYEDQPMSYLYLQHPIVGISGKFHGCTPHALSLYEGIESWWREP